MALTDADLNRTQAQLDYLDRHRDPDSCGYDKLMTKGDLNADRDALHVWRRPGAAGVYEYLMIGSAPYRYDTFCSVVLDLDYHREWDHHCEELHIIDSHDGNDYIYWDVKYPFWLSNRDYVYVRRYRKGVSLFTSTTRSAEHMKYPETRNKVRVTSYHSTYLCRVRDENTVDYIYSLFDNPRGIIPTRVVNWVVSNSIPSFMRTMFRACDALEKRNT